MSDKLKSVRPLAYIRGYTIFGDLKIAVDERVLVPRRETELLVEIACQLPEGASIHEVGTGSGAVALSIKSQRPDLKVTASDSEEEAVWVARDNANDLDIGIAIYHGPFLDIPELHGQQFGLVVANLPYLTQESAESRSALLEAEPDVALFDIADDGLGLIRALIEELDDGQMVAVEHDAHHGEPIREKLRHAVTLRDYMGIERVTVGTVANVRD